MRIEQGPSGRCPHGSPLSSPDGEPVRRRQRTAGPSQERARARQRQAGFSLIEVSIVTAIILLIAVIGIPAIGDYVMENKVPKVGQELARFVMHARVNGSVSSGHPYVGMDTNHLAAQVANSTVLSISTTGDVLHGLGSGGLIELEPEDAGAGFVLRLTKVNHVACPSIASILQRLADRITVRSGAGQAVPVKGDTQTYSALTAELACSKGDVNQFEFHVT